MTATGQLIEIFDTQQVTDKFAKREFVVEMGNNPQYPETVIFQLVQDKCDLLDGYKKGDQIEVGFDLKGRKWTNKEGIDKYFNSLQAWKLNKVGAQQAAPAQQEDDLPF